MLLTDTQLTKDDFDQYEWQKVIESCEPKTFHSYHRVFFDEETKAQEGGDTKARNVFRLLVAVTSLYPKLDTPHQPFGPMMRFGDQRTPILDDFTDDDIALFKGLIAEIIDAELRARLSDVVWVRLRDFTIAGIAVDSYLDSARVLESPTEWTESAQRIERALQIAVTYRKNGPYFTRPISFVETILDKYDGQDSLWLSHKMMNLLILYQQGDPLKYIPLSEKIARQSEATGQWRRAREACGVQADWYRLAKDADSQRQALLRAAETYVKEAEEATHRNPPSHMIAAKFIEEGIEALRRIGGEQTRVVTLHRVLLDYQERILDEMGTIPVKQDITQIVNEAKQKVTGKHLRDALSALATIAYPPQKAELRTQAESTIGNSIQFLVAATFFREGGKVDAERPALNLEDPSVDANQELIKSQMLMLGAFYRGLISESTILPAVKQIASEHDIRVADLMEIVRNNPFVPPGHETIYARGLHAGLTDDFTQAIHFLMPQIESSFRYVLDNAGVITSSFDDQGIQDEYPLGRLLSLPEAEQIFGIDLVFDLQGLLVEHMGSNLEESSGAWTDRR